MTKYDIYNSPSDLLRDGTLSHDEKTELLKRWCADENALLRASGEGMGGGERPHLKQAQEALNTLISSKS